MVVMERSVLHRVLRGGQWVSSPELLLEPQPRLTKESVFQPHLMTKKATILAGYVEGKSFLLNIDSIDCTFFNRVFDKVKSRSAHMKSHVVKSGGGK